MPQLISPIRSFIRSFILNSLSNVSLHGLQRETPGFLRVVVSSSGGSPSWWASSPATCPPPTHSWLSPQYAPPCLCEHWNPHYLLCPFVLRQPPTSPLFWRSHPLPSLDPKGKSRGSFICPELHPCLCVCVCHTVVTLLTDTIFSLLKQAIFEGWGQVAFASAFSIPSTGLHV